jgi:four helix bundle protein
MIHNYKNLEVWKEAMLLVKEVYLVTEKFPQSEVYGLTSQIRRSAISIPSNIAEGKLRSGDKEFKQFLFIAFGSGGELETQIEIAKQLPKTKDLDYSKVDSKLEIVMKMLNKLISIVSASR